MRHMFILGHILSRKCGVIGPLVIRVEDIGLVGPRDKYSLHREWVDRIGRLKLKHPLIMMLIFSIVSMVTFGYFS